MVYVYTALTAKQHCVCDKKKLEKTKLNIFWPTKYHHHPWTTISLLHSLSLIIRCNFDIF